MGISLLLQTMQGRPFGRISFALAAAGVLLRDIQKALGEEDNGYEWSQRRLKYMLTNVVSKTVTCIEQPKWLLESGSQHILV